MAIVPLEKMTLYGAESQKESVIDWLQQLGCAHLVSLSPNRIEAVPGDSSKDARDALRYLKDCPVKLRSVTRHDRFDREQVVSIVLRVQDEANELTDEQDDLNAAIEALEPWGEFRLPEDHSIGDVRFWFVKVPRKSIAAMESFSSWHKISEDNDNAYVLILSPDEPEELPGDLCELDPRPLSELRSRLDLVEEALEELHHQRVGLTRWRTLLEGAIDEAEDAAAREQATASTLDDKQVFAIRGWIPAAASEEVRRFASENRLAVTIEPPSPGDDPPTLLDNPEAFAGSEGLVTFYKTPAYRSWDPSLLAYGSFALFFAMIIADAGYGILLAILTGYLWKRMGKTQGGRRGRNVLATLVVFTIVYGVICGSYFGLYPPSGSILDRMKILDAESQATMMPLSILIGVVHLSLANLAIAWLHRGRSTALAPLGWVGVMVGASLLGFASFGSLSDEGLAGQISNVGAVLLVGGLFSVFFFSSPRPIASLSLKNHLLRGFEGVQAVLGFSGLFGDVLSYLRLFALGLSSAKLSQTFNSLGADAWDAAGFGVIAAIAIIILGHTLNLVLCLMGAVVHGLRLNCIEFFKWGLPDEGYPYKAFAKKVRQT